MARFTDIYLYVSLVSVGLSLFQGMAIYIVDGVNYTIGAGTNLPSDSGFGSNSSLNVIGCDVVKNLSAACTPPSFLTNPQFFSGAVFGYIYGGLEFLAHVVFAPYYVVQLISNISGSAGDAFSELVGAGLTTLFVFFWILILTGRYFES